MARLVRRFPGLTPQLQLAAPAQRLPDERPASCGALYAARPDLLRVKGWVEHDVQDTIAVVAMAEPVRHVADTG